jgi:hypothetical protein
MVYTKEELSAIAKVAVENNIYVISDEIYEHLVYEGEATSIAAICPEMKDLTIIINGVSKRNYNGDFYEINNKIINLSNPLLTQEAKDEMDNTMYSPMDIEGRSFSNLYKLIIEDDITDLKNSDHFSSFFSSFKPLADKEIKRFNEFIKNNK